MWPEAHLKLNPNGVVPTLVHDGKNIDQQEGRTYEYAVKEPGNYRVEAELDIVGEWTPWVYENPIRVTAAAEAGA